MKTAVMLESEREGVVVESFECELVLLAVQFPDNRSIVPVEVEERAEIAT